MDAVYGEFVYDSSVVLAQVFANSRFRSRVKKIQGDVSRLHIPCHVTPYVVRECNKKVGYIGGYVVQTVRDLNRNISSNKNLSGANPNFSLSEGDLQLFMQYFANAAASLAKSSGQQQTEKEALEYIETWIVKTFEDELGISRNLDPKLFFAKCVTEASHVYSNWTSELSKHGAGMVSSTLSQNAFQKIRNSLLAIPNEDDIRVLAEAAEYRNLQNRLVFVALDYKEIIKFASLIQKTLGMSVADPLYALTTLKNLPT